MSLGLLALSYPDDNNRLANNTLFQLKFHCHSRMQVKCFIPKWNILHLRRQTTVLITDLGSVQFATSIPKMYFQVPFMTDLKEVVVEISFCEM